MQTDQSTTARQPRGPLTGKFQAGQVLLIAGGHFTHDIFTSFLAPLLPLLIEKLSLSLTLSGALVSFQQLPSLLNPFLGALADKINLRWLAVVAPAITAVAMCLTGLAPTYAVLAILLLVTGISSALWHVPAPVMIARSSGSRIGQGMSLFMLGGELSRTIGPLLAVTAVSFWGLAGIYRLIPLGFAASFLIYWRTRGMDIRPPQRADNSWAQTWQELRRVFLALCGVIICRSFMVASLTTFLPTFLDSEGASLWQAGSALSILEFAGAGGVLISGTISDRLGRRRVLTTVIAIAPLLMLLFLRASGWTIVPALVILGFVLLSTNPVMMALIQEYGRDHPATANGLYMFMGFVSRAIIVVIVGAIADRWGLRAAFHISALVGFLGIPFALSLPKHA